LLHFAQPKEEPIKGAGSSYVFYNQMDDANKEMMDVCAEKGMNGMVEAILSKMKQNKMSYSQMRELYG
jgi:hypothetical protein